LLVEVGELLGGGQVAVDEEVADLGEGGLLGDLLDPVAAVAQDALLAVDEGDRALAGAGVAVAGVEGDGARLRAQRGDVDPHLALAAHDDRELVLFAVEDQLCRAHGASARAYRPPCRAATTASPRCGVSGARCPARRARAACGAAARDGPADGRGGSTRRAWRGRARRRPARNAPGSGGEARARARGRVPTGSRARRRARA